MTTVPIADATLCRINEHHLRGRTHENNARPSPASNVAISIPLNGCVLIHTLVTEWVSCTAWACDHLKFRCFPSLHRPLPQKHSRTLFFAGHRRPKFQISPQQRTEAVVSDAINILVGDVSLAIRLRNRFRFLFVCPKQGGAHVLMGDGGVVFKTDSVDLNVTIVATDGNTVGGSLRLCVGISNAARLTNCCEMRLSGRV